MPRTDLWLNLTTVTLDRHKIAAIVPKLLEWFSENARDLPWRRPRDPYAIWVSEIMLQQTQVATVVPYWERWMRELPTIQALAEAPPQNIHKLWEGLGYYTRVRNMQKAAKVIQAEHSGRFPEQFEEVLELPGIGRYTAGAICSIAFNQPQPILDGNVIRVLTRVFGIGGNPRERNTNHRLWALARSLVESSHAAGRAQPGGKRGRRACAELNESLMELGALICTPKAPNCGECPLARQCVALRKNLVFRLPNLGRRPVVTPRWVLAFVVERGGRFLVSQRPAGVVNGHLWEFPNAEVHSESADPAKIAARMLGSATGLAPLGVIKHSITRFRITMRAFRLDARGVRAGAGSWRSLAELERLPFSSAHRRILGLLADRQR